MWLVLPGGSWSSSRSRLRQMQQNYDNPLTAARPSLARSSCTVLDAGRSPARCARRRTADREPAAGAGRTSPCALEQRNCNAFFERRLKMMTPAFGSPSTPRTVGSGRNPENAYSFLASLIWPSEHHADFEPFPTGLKAGIHAASSHFYPFKSPTRFCEDPIFIEIRFT